ncbi:ferredoxin reductase [Nocardioides yefusunii]|uniref:Ferredoxin reductase n=1 Tax=Nocardioides yefusunii TaxID=2500546 RepID=A0ABW1QUA2_9ACTN|nr:ferredoxin reductase [Nocardioides yefusunii]
MTATASEPIAPAPAAADVDPRANSGRKPRLRDRAVKLVEAATTPLMPADYMDLFAPLRPGAELRGRIISVTPETADAATIVIRPGADWAGHVPGQYVRVGIDVEGVRLWRAYSLTHGPRGDKNISITVKAVPDGVVSHHLVHRCPVGSLVHLEPAAGEFVMPDVNGGKYLMVTAGSGVTPVIGMLRNLFPVADSGVVSLDRSKNFDITVIHVAPSEPDSIFLRDLQALDAAGKIRLIARYDDTHGFLDVNDIPSMVPDVAERITLACGPGGLLDALGEHHARHGLPLIVEQFRTSRVEAGEGGTVVFEKSDVTLEIDGATTLLDAAEEAGMLMRSGCRMGLCMGCLVPLEEGTVRDLRNGDLTTAVPGESGAVKIQTCISSPAGPCRISK